MKLREKKFTVGSILSETLSDAASFHLPLYQRLLVWAALLLDSILACFCRVKKESLVEALVLKDKKKILLNTAMTTDLRIT